MSAVLPVPTVLIDWASPTPKASAWIQSHWLCAYCVPVAPRMVPSALPAVGGGTMAMPLKMVRNSSPAWLPSGTRVVRASVA